jgi:hypothetical protein
MEVSFMNHIRIQFKIIIIWDGVAGNMGAVLGETPSFGAEYANWQQLGANVAWSDVMYLCSRSVHEENDFIGMPLCRRCEDLSVNLKYGATGKIGGYLKQGFECFIRVIEIPVAASSLIALGLDTPSASITGKLSDVAHFCTVNRTREWCSIHGIRLNSLMYKSDFVKKMKMVRKIRKGDFHK